MFLDVLRRRNPRFVESRDRAPPRGPHPGQRLRPRPRRRRGQHPRAHGRSGPPRAEGLRHDQAGGPLQRLLPGRAARRHPAVGRGRHGLRTGDPPRRAAGRPPRASRAGRPAPRRGRQPPCGPTTGPCSTRRRPARRPPRPPPPATCSRCSPASRPRATHSTAATRADSRPARSPPSPTGSTRWREAASPASPRSRRCSSTAETRKVRPTPNLATLERAAEALARAGPQRHRDQRPRHHLDRRRCGAGRGRRDADRARERLARHHRAPRLRGSAGAPGGALPDRGLASRRGQGLLLRRRLLHRPDLPALRREGHRRRRRRRPPRRSAASRCRRRRRSTITP